MQDEFEGHFLRTTPPSPPLDATTKKFRARAPKNGDERLQAAAACNGAYVELGGAAGSEDGTHASGGRERTSQGGERVTGGRWNAGDGNYGATLHTVPEHGAGGKEKQLPDKCMARLQASRGYNINVKDVAALAVTSRNSANTEQEPEVKESCCKSGSVKNMLQLRTMESLCFWAKPRSMRMACTFQVVTSAPRNVENT